MTSKEQIRLCGCFFEWASALRHAINIRDQKSWTDCTDFETGHPHVDVSGSIYGEFDVLMKVASVLTELQSSCRVVKLFNGVLRFIPPLRLQIRNGIFWITKLNQYRSDKRGRGAP